MELADPIAVTLFIAAHLDRLGIRYCVGGSLASSLHGVPRATQDVDLVAELGAEHVSPLVDALRDTFYVDADMIHEALARCTCFNVIHLDTMFKVDVFVREDGAWAREEMKRRQTKQVTATPAQSLVVASAEDIVLHKLWWYKLGQEVSERQWRDVIGVLKVQGDSLDMAYVRRWARQLDVDALLDRALDELRRERSES